MNSSRSVASHFQIFDLSFCPAHDSISACPNVSLLVSQYFSMSALQLFSISVSQLFK